MKKLLVLIFCIILLVGTISAWEFDNIKNYDEETQTINIRNSILGIPFLQLDQVAEIKLDTPLNNYVIRGEDKLVAEFTIENFKDYTEGAFDNLDFYNIKKNMNQFNREFVYKYKKFYDVKIDDYEEVCKEKEVVKVNGTYIEKYDCVKNQIGSHIEQRFNWIDLNEKLALQKGKITIGIFTDVYANEEIEWIPTLFGVRIDEWATWTEGLNVGLTAYYNLDEQDTTGTGTIYDSLGINNGTNTGASNNSGKINTAYSFITNDYINLGTSLTITGEMVISFWFKANSDYTTSQTIVGNNDATSAGASYNINFGRTNNEFQMMHDGTIISISSMNINDDNWHHIVVVRNGSTGNWDISWYIDGSFDETDNTATNPADSSSANTCLGRIGDNSDHYLNGVLDEVGIWNRTLSASEISGLWNSGDGISYTDDCSAIEVTQSYPADYFNTTDTTVEISCNFSTVGEENITDITILVYNSSDNLDYTNTESGLNLKSYNKTWTTTALIDDTYKWACLGEGTSIEDYAGNRTFTIDTTTPTISLDVAQPTTSGLQVIPFNISINYSAIDTHIQSCWYNSTWNLTTTSLTCNQNLTNITINSYKLNQTIYVYVNDSFGHENVKSKKFSIDAIEIAQSYQSSTTEGNTDTFQINLTIPSSKVITIKDLFYNGTSKGAGTLTTIAGNNYSIIKNIEIPDISAAGNRTFYWNISLDDGTNFNSREINQYTTALALDDCSTYGTLVLNYSLKDEATQSVLSLSPNLNSTIDIHVNIFTTDTSTLITNYSKRYTNDTNPQICIVNEALNNSKYLMDTTTRYTASGYSTEYYNSQSFSLTNNSIPQTINLFDLKTADSTDFLITFKDETFDLVDDAVIDITRYYVDEGLFKTVERPKTDSFGQTVGHFVESDVIYTLIISKQGTILATFNNMVAVCADSTIGDCKINLNSFLTGVPTTDFTTEFDLNVATTFDEDTRRITTIFSTLSGGVATVQLNATQFTSYGNITVCNHLLTTSSGTLICDIPDSFGNVSVIAELYSGSRLVKTYTFAIEEEALVTFGYAGIIMVFILVLTLPLMFITSTIGMVIGALLGLIIAALLNIYDGGGIIGVGSTILWAIIAGGILIWKIAQKGEST